MIKIPSTSIRSSTFLLTKNYITSKNENVRQGKVCSFYITQFSRASNYGLPTVVADRINNVMIFPFYKIAGKLPLDSNIMCK